MAPPPDIPVTLATRRQVVPHTPGAAPDQRRTLFSALGVTVAAASPVWLVGGLAVQIRGELGFGEARLGLLVAIFFLMSSLLSLPAGRVVEHIGWRRGIVAASAVSALCLLIIATLSRSWAHLAWAVGLGGVANAVAQPAGNLGVARSIRPGRQGIALGIKQSAIPLATLTSGTAVPLVALTVGWRWAFAIAAGAAVLIGLSTPRVVQAPPPVSACARREGDAPLLPLVVLACAGGMGSVVGTSFGAFIVDSSVSAGVAPATAGLLLAIGSVCGVAARIALGWVADRWAVSPLALVAALMAAGGVAILLIPLQSEFVALLPLTCLVFATGWAWPGLFAFAIVRLNQTAPAAATGICLTGIYLGGVLGPLAFGITVEHLGYTPAWVGASGALFTGAALVTVSKVIVRRKKATASEDAPEEVM